jgi:hypothetical protein
LRQSEKSERADNHSARKTIIEQGGGGGQARGQRVDNLLQVLKKLKPKGTTTHRMSSVTWTARGVEGRGMEGEGGGDRLGQGEGERGL